MKYFVEDQNTLKAIFTFDNFLEAIDFVNQVADVAMQLDHHPDILIHGYKNVTITTTTHEECNKITDLDKKLAQQIEALSPEL
jgi:4a-hydroxytetrahydrobiopterin dehydratase